LCWPCRDERRRSAALATDRQRVTGFSAPEMLERLRRRAMRLASVAWCRHGLQSMANAALPEEQAKTLAYRMRTRRRPRRSSSSTSASRSWSRGTAGRSVTGPSLRAATPSSRGQGQHAGEDERPARPSARETCRRGGGDESTGSARIDPAEEIEAEALQELCDKLTRMAPARNQTARRWAGSRRAVVRQGARRRAPRQRLPSATARAAASSCCRTPRWRS